MPLNVGRPDLIAYTRNSMFAIEAKGYSRGHGNMATHKMQSQTGGIPVNFTIACVSYNLYHNILCKYHDPFNDKIQFDDELFRELTRDYYKGLLEFLNQKYFEYHEMDFQGEKFYEVELSYRNLGDFLPNGFPFILGWHFDMINFYRPRLILPKKIRDFAEDGLTRDTKPFIFDSQQQENNIYIDNDRIGLQIRRQQNG